MLWFCPLLQLVARPVRPRHHGGRVTDGNYAAALRASTKASSRSSACAAGAVEMATGAMAIFIADSAPTATAVTALTVPVRAVVSCWWLAWRQLSPKCEGALEYCTTRISCPCCCAKCLTQRQSRSRPNAPGMSSGARMQALVAQLRLSRRVTVTPSNRTRILRLAGSPQNDSYLSCGAQRRIRDSGVPMR